MDSLIEKIERELGSSINEEMKEKFAGYTFSIIS